MTARHYLDDDIRRTKRIETITRRRDYLRGLITKDQGNSWDIAEEAALTWALDLLEALFHQPEVTAISKEQS
jgi:hypothetical protein